MTIPVFIFLVVAPCLMLESPRYLVAIGKTEEALQILHKIAEINGKKLPDRITLVPENEKGFNNGKSTGFFVNLKQALCNWEIARSLIGLTMLGLAGKMILFGMGFVKTELIFKSGSQNSEFCKEEFDANYLLTSNDYLKLLGFQLSADIMSTLITIPMLKNRVSCKLTALFCFGISLPLTAGLYTCPSIWVGLIVFTVIQTLLTVANVNMWLNLSGLLPTKVRGSLFGICTFIMYSPTFLMPFMQALSKESEHLVTTVNMGFLVCGFIGGFLLPRRVYTN